MGALAGSLVLILFIILKFGAGLNGSQAVVAVIELIVNVYGITILVLLFGVGLIQLPLHLWTLSDVQKRLH